MSTTKTVTRTLEEYKMLYGSVDDWYDQLKGGRKSWVDNNWRSMLEHFLEYAEQSLKDSVPDEETELCPYCDTDLNAPECHIECLIKDEDGSEMTVCRQCWEDSEDDLRREGWVVSGECESYTEEGEKGKKPTPCQTCGREAKWLSKYDRWSVVDDFCEGCYAEEEAA